MNVFDLQLMFRIREDTDDFISEPLFNLLDGFHAGYRLFTSSTERLVIVDFRGWLIEKYSLQIGEGGYPDAIRLLSKNEREAYQLFWGELEECMKMLAAECVSTVCQKHAFQPVSGVLDLLHRYPRAYFYPYSVRVLRAWLDGYRLKLHEHGASELEDFDFHAFEQWLTLRSRVPAGTRWEHIMLHLAQFDERDAMGHFLRLHKLFLEGSDTESA